jgi:hypothetical protein
VVSKGSRPERISRCVCACSSWQCTTSQVRLMYTIAAGSSWRQFRKDSTPCSVRILIGVARCVTCTKAMRRPYLAELHITSSHTVHDARQQRRAMPSTCPPDLTFIADHTPLLLPCCSVAGPSRVNAAHPAVATCAAGAAKVFYPVVLMLTRCCPRRSVLAFYATTLVPCMVRCMQCT